MKFDFDTYEFAGLIAPGSVALLGIYLLYPSILNQGNATMTVVALAFAAYVLGHLLAAIGNVADPAFNLLPGKRIEKIAFNEWEKNGYCTQTEADRVKDSLATLRDESKTKDKATIYDATKMRNSVLSKGSKACWQRLETFNGLYNLSRGLTVAFLIDALVAIVSARWEVAIILAFCAGLSCYRVDKFKNTFNRELVQQYLMTLE